MATIQTALSISANKSTATTTPGPLSVALATSATTSLTVDKTVSEVMTVAYTDATDTAVLLINGRGTYMGTGAAGTDGGYVYIKNTTASGTNLIMICLHPAGLEDIDDNGDDHRFFTLKKGEWAFFPYDYTQDISVKANAASQTLEYWLFDRG